MSTQRKNSRCILCFKPSFTSSNLNGSDSKFLLLLSRHLKIRPESKPPKVTEQGELLFCENCSELGSSFNDLYFQLECIRLQVNWKIRRIYETMSSAGRIPSRFNAFRKQFETSSDDDDGGKQVYTKIVRLRKDLMSYSQQILKSSVPKLYLKRVCREDNIITTEKVSPRKAAVEACRAENRLLIEALISYVVVLHLSLPLHPSYISNFDYHNYQDCTKLEDLGLTTECEAEDGDVGSHVPSDNEESQPHQSEYDELVDSAITVSVAEDFNFSSDVVENCRISKHSVQVSEVIHDDADTDSRDRKLSLADQVKQETTGGELDRRDLSQASESLSPVTIEDASEGGFTSVHYDLEEVSSRRFLRSLLHCQKCPKTFTTQSSLTTHLKLHDDFAMEGDSSGSESSSSDENSDVDMDSLKVEESSDEQEDYENQAEYSPETKGLQNEGLASNLPPKPCVNTVPNECEICHEMLSCKTAVEKHRVLKHNLQKYIRCVVCGLYFSSRHLYLLHRTKIENSPCFTTEPDELKRLISLPSQYPFTTDFGGRNFCPVEDCFEVFLYQEWLEVHIKTHGKWNCNFCSEEFTKLHLLALHEISEHGKNQDAPNTSKITLFCTRCDDTFKSKNTVVTHFLQDHFNIPKVPSTKQINIQKKCSQNQLNKCEICSVTFSCEAAVEKHRVVAHNLEKYVRCKVCSKYFQSHCYLVVHRTQHKTSTCFTTDPKDLEPAAAPQFPYQSRIMGRLFCTFANCYEVFEHEEWLQIHLKTHGNWDCSLCPEEFSKAHDFAWHEITAHNTRSVKDPDVVKYLQRFQRKKKGNYENINYVCSRCPTACESKRGIVAHFLHNHLDIPKVSEITTVQKQCEICKKVLAPNAGDLQMKTHLKMHDVEGMDPATIAICTICKAPFNKRVNLTTHLRVEHKQTLLYKCPHCEEQFKDSTRFKAHLQRKHKGKSSGLPGTFRCEICSERFSNKFNFEQHKTIHVRDDDSEKEFKCESCDKVFSTKGSYQRHLWYMHKPVKQTWHCEQCGKVFKSHCKLKQHTSYTHTDPSQWKFTCPEEGCGKKCWSKQKLTEHVRTHSKERPFVCDVCGESYRFRQYLRSHLAKVHGSSAAKTLPTQSYVKPFDQTVKRTEAEESDESSSSSA